MKITRDMAMEKLCYRMVMYISVNIATVLDMAKVSMCSRRMVPDIMATGDTDINTVKGSYGTLMERDMKVRKNVYENSIRIRSEEVAHSGTWVDMSICIFIQLFLYRTSHKTPRKACVPGIPKNCACTSINKRFYY